MSGRIKREVVASPLPPILGKLKVGKKSEKGYPMSVDYFVATGKYAPLFYQRFGEKPNTLLVYFPSNDPELVCKEEYVYRNNAGKKCASGDGETFKVWSNKINKFVRVTTDEYPNIMEIVSKKFPSQKGWEVVLTLNVVLPELNKIFGVWTLQTKGSASSIPHIRDTFDSLLEKNGSVENVLFDLHVEFAKSDSPMGTRFPVISIVPNETQMNINRIKMLQQ